MAYEDDPCECLLSHEAMMQRLLNILRQSQDECSEGGNCTTEINISTNTFTIGLITLLSAFAMLMFYTRPNSLRSSSNLSNEKSRNNFGGQDQQPPPSVG